MPMYALQDCAARDKTLDDAGENTTDFGLETFDFPVEATGDSIGPVADELLAAEDERIREIVAKQESVGLKAVTDGEMRRSFWHYDFMGALDGFELVERDEGVQFAGIKLRPIFPTITGHVDFPDDHPMLEHYRFLASVTGVQPKISIPGPSCCHFRTELRDGAPAEYQDV